jgi:hypothetical protein
MALGLEYISPKTVLLQPSLGTRGRCAEGESFWEVRIWRMISFLLLFCHTMPRRFLACNSEERGF